MKFKVAIVQFEIAQFKTEKNLKKAARFVEKAKAKGAELVVFPEDFVTGPICGQIEYTDTKHVFRDFFIALAKKHAIDIVTGSFMERAGKRVYNTTYYIDAKGKVKTRYRKINLWHPERKYMTPGKKAMVFNTKFGKVGLMICWDLIFPEMFRKMLSKDVEIVICTSYWCDSDAGPALKQFQQSEKHHVDSIAEARAFEDEIIFMYCNAAGAFDYDGQYDPLIGHSQVTAPLEGVIKRLNHNRQAMMIVDVDTNLLKMAEKTYKVRKDLKKGVFAQKRYT
ncbi:carbon-nitrogen hydrolase family protein [Candidatus Gracilibacteria bacterium]|nr:carbon-nitrogen hydrolase family protein [Candidatus Gracilibacteria bacterium]